MQSSTYVLLMYTYYIGLFSLGLSGGTYGTVLGDWSGGGGGGRCITRTTHIKYACGIYTHVDVCICVCVCMCVWYLDLIEIYLLEQNTSGVINVIRVKQRNLT
ncbi:hypothetical protein F5X96DRAFT_186993 [Biscogniauxia mediterranea]|nr:hypothetical protein F5X96DRAFT_186993 [Biscogniauxia mediterranea]